MLHRDLTDWQERGRGLESSLPNSEFQRVPTFPRVDLSEELEFFEVPEWSNSTREQRGKAFTDARRVVLQYAGIDIENFNQVRNLWPDEWPKRVKEGVAQDDVAEGRCDVVGRALECVAWHRYKLLRNDKALQMLLRAEALLPGDPRIVRRLAQLALEVTVAHLPDRLHKDKREEIVLSHKDKARRAISDTLSFEFGITGDMVKDAGGVSAYLQESFGKNDPAHDTTFELLYAYAALSYQVAMSPVDAFFISRDGRDKRAQLFTVSLGYVDVLLDILQCPRKPREALNQLVLELDESGPESQPFGDRTQQMAQVLHLWGTVLWDWSEMGFKGVGEWRDVARELMGFAERLNKA